MLSVNSTEGAEEYKKGVPISRRAAEQRSSTGVLLATDTKGDSSSTATDAEYKEATAREGNKYRVRVGPSQLEK